MDMPYHLKTLPPEALDILRYYGTITSNVAHADLICEGTGLSDRGFGKAIRRLVTKGYVVMDGGLQYRLTEAGNRAVEELGESEVDSPGDSSRRVDTYARTEARVLTVTRRLIAALPQPLVAGETVALELGVLEADDDNIIPDDLMLLVRVGVLNGDPWPATDLPVMLTNRITRSAVDVTPGLYSQVRVRVQVYQMDDDTGDAQLVGGMYLDVDVLSNGAPGPLTAFGSDLTLTLVG